MENLNFFERLAKVRVLSLYLFSFLVGLRIYQHPGNFITSVLSNTITLDARQSGSVVTENVVF